MTTTAGRRCPRRPSSAEDLPEEPCLRQADLGFGLGERRPQLREEPGEIVARSAHDHERRLVAGHRVREWACR